MAVHYFPSIPIKEYKDSTLMGLKKEELVKYIRHLENSVKNLDFALDVQARNSQKYELVTHAHWKEFEDYSGVIYPECSNCGLVWWLEEGNAEDNEMFYCPKCGAKMDEEADNDQIHRR